MKHRLALCSKAKEKFQSAIDILGNVPALTYSVALCHYKLGNYGEALKYSAKIIEQVDPRPLHLAAVAGPETQAVLLAQIGPWRQQCTRSRQGS